jgi:hypothetical protein
MTTTLRLSKIFSVATYPGFKRSIVTKKSLLMRIKGKKVKGTDVTAKPLIVYEQTTINSSVLPHL